MKKSLLRIVIGSQLSCFSENLFCIHLHVVSSYKRYWCNHSFKFLRIRARET